MKIKNIAIIIVAVILVVFIAIYTFVKAIVNSLNTEPIILDELSKKILNSKQLTEDYYSAIEKEKKGEDARIIIENEEYRVIRINKH